jgi:uncharacterized protein (TIGR02266 family)
MVKKDRRQDRPDSRGSDEVVDRRKADRRGGTRVSISLWVEEKKGEDLYFQQAGNLSTGGVFFERTIPHPIGTQVKLKFELPGKEGVIETTGEVVSAPGSSNGFGAGVRFVNLDPVEQRLIEEFVKENL